MSQAIADLAILLSIVSGADHARAAIERALRETGLSRDQTITAAEFEQLVVAIAADGGPIEDLVRQIAVRGLDADDGAGTTTRRVDATDRSAA